MPASIALVSADSNGPFDLIGGIPVHPLVVHAAVVLVPLAALGVLLMALMPRFSRALGWLVILAALAATGACWVAKQAGEQLALRVGEPGFDHQSLGTWMPYFASALAVVAIGLWLLDRRTVGEQPTPRGALGIVVAVLAGVVAAGNVLWVYRVGDSGARSVWSGPVATSELPAPSPRPSPSPLPSAPASPTPTSSPGATGTTSPALYSMAQVAGHNIQGDCWAAIDGSVYDLTVWIAANPVGAERIIALCGTDATAAFATQPDGQPLPREQLSRFMVGTLST